MTPTSRTMVRQRQEIDATGITLGRVATRVATLLRGKHKPTFVPHVDGGDFVRVRNVHAIRFTGRKMQTKAYHRATGYPGGLRSELLRTRWARDPERVLRDAVYGMLPSNRLRVGMLKRLTISRD